MKAHIFLSAMLHISPSLALFIVTFLFQGRVVSISARIACSHVRTVAWLVTLSFALTFSVKKREMGLFETAKFSFAKSILYCCFFFLIFINQHVYVLSLLPKFWLDKTVLQLRNYSSYTGFMLFFFVSVKQLVCSPFWHGSDCPTVT